MAVVATLVVQSSVLGSDFQDEDLRHIYESRELHPIEFLTRPYGNHFCASFRLCVMLLHGLFGIRPPGYFAIILLTHAMHVVLLYAIIRGLTESPILAGVFAGLWGATPIAQGTLQFLAAYSHVLGVTALLWPLWELVQARESRRPPTPWAIVRMSILLFLGSATELTGSLVAAVFPLVAYMLLPKECSPLRTFLRLLPSLLLSISVVLAYTGRGNTSFLKFFAWEPALVSFGELMAYGAGSTFGGSILAISADGTSWLLGLSKETAVVSSLLLLVPFLCIVGIRLVRGHTDERRILLTSIGLSGLVYAAIASGRSMMMLGRLAELATQTRYHYEASVGMVIAAAVAIANLPLQLPRLRARPALYLAGALAGAWALAAHLAARSMYLRGGGRQEWTRDWAELAEASVRLLSLQVPVHGILYVNNDAFRPATLIYRMGVPREDFPGIGAYWVTVHGVDPVGERTFRFVETDAALLERIRAQSRREVGEMFVSPNEVSRAGGRIRTLEEAAPPAVMKYLLGSADPIFVANDHAEANRLRQVLQSAAAHPLK